MSRAPRCHWLAPLSGRLLRRGIGLSFTPCRRTRDLESAATPDDPSSVADLYQVDPAQFTALRNALVKKMRAAGRRADADTMAKLRRPPVTAWALNLVARDQPGLIQAVLDAGGRLRSAMERAVEGDASRLRDAQAAQRSAVTAAVSAAAGRLQNAGYPGGDTARMRMVATLGAAAVDDTVATQLHDGVLDGDRSAPGFGLDAMSVPAREPAGRAGRQPGLPATDGWPEHDAVGGGARSGGAVAPSDAPAAAKGRSTGAADRAAERARLRQEEAVEAERRRRLRVRLAELKAEATRLGRRAERLQGQAEEAERLAAEARRLANEAEAEAAEARRNAESVEADGV